MGLITFPIKFSADGRRVGPVIEFKLFRCHPEWYYACRRLKRPRSGFVRVGLKRSGKCSKIIRDRRCLRFALEPLIGWDREEKKQTENRHCHHQFNQTKRCVRPGRVPLPGPAI